ncbi:CDP-glucose 4,6-dehydratase [Geminicoccaceae bacterium 1502E]|nr:CDP-glucose 4,6-dehydratase [Geminicoccaceae bacterium 1502E]
MRWDPSFWQGKRVLVTGHTGFKGAWLAAWLDRLGAAVTGLALPPASGPALFDALALGQRVGSIAGDVREAALVARVLGREAPEIVFHLAGQSVVLTGLEDPVGTFETNVVGTVNLLQAVRATPSVRAVVVVTSDKCYRQPHGACREGDALGGEDPYSASKAAAELVVGAYRSCFLQAAHGRGLATARAGNVIGAGDFSAHRLVPDLVRACMEGRPPILRQPGAIRPWQHVLDALWGYLLLGEALHHAPVRFSTAWNFGPPPGSEWSVARLAAAFSRRLGVDPWRETGAASPHEAACQRLTPERARRRLGWQTLLPLEEAADWTVEGYRGLLEGQTAWLGAQIDRYVERARGKTPVRRARAGCDGAEDRHALARTG